MRARCDRYRVLIADDNVDAGRTLALLLQHLRYDVRVADNGRSAFELALDFRPSAGIFDIGMPGLTGYELAAYIRRESWGRDTVLIALSGWGTEQDRTLAFGAGFTHHLTKPAELDQVLALLRPSLPIGNDTRRGSAGWVARALAAVRHPRAGERSAPNP